MRKNLIACFSLSLLLPTILLAESSTTTVTLQETLAEHGVHLNSSKPGSKNSSKLLKNQHVSSATKQKTIIEGQLEGEIRVRVEIIDHIEDSPARELAKSETIAFKKLYESEQTPYMGDISQAIGGCSARFGVIGNKVNFLGAEQTAYLGAADAKFAFGICDSLQAKYKGAFISYYDSKTKSFWSWHFFAPWTDKKSSLNNSWLTPILERFQK